MNPTRGGWLIAVCLLVAVVLSALHLPESWPQTLGWLRPAWVVLALFFWVMATPHRVGLISAWLLGALVDVVQADPLGLNGALFATVTYVVWKFYERLRMYSVFQQAAVLFFLVVVTEAVRLVVQNVMFDRSMSFGFLLTAVASAICWPLVYLLLLKARTYVRVD